LHFERPEYLWLLLFVPLLLFFLNRYFSNGEWIRQILGRARATSFLSSAKRDLLVVVLSTVGVVCLALALARPYLQEIAEKPEYQRMNLVFLLDVSPSMNARDVWPSRIDRSKDVIRRFIQRDTGILRYGLVSFSESSVILSYLTSDLQNLLFYLDFLRPDRNLILGTDLGAALTSGLQVLEKGRVLQPADGRSIQKSVMVLISDGEDHGEELDSAVENVHQRRIRVHTIGIGTAQGGTMQVVNERGELEYLKDEQGRRILSRLSVETLQKVAQQTGGRFFKASSGSELEFALQSILDSERQVVGYRVGSVRRDLFRYFMGMTFVSHLAVMTLRL
jgi:Ca-activated chloride channel family protein